MRTVKLILADLTEAKTKWHTESQAAPEDERNIMSGNIKALTDELSKTITKGAEPCPQCGEKPHGIKQPRHYEIGCLVDPMRARGETREEAVEAWNSGDYYTGA